MFAFINLVKPDSERKKKQVIGKKYEMRAQLDHKSTFGQSQTDRNLHSVPKKTK